MLQRAQHLFLPTKREREQEEEELESVDSWLSVPLFQFVVLIEVISIEQWKDQKKWLIDINFIIFVVYTF